MTDDYRFSRLAVQGFCTLALIYFGVNATLGLLQDTNYARGQHNSTRIEHAPIERQEDTSDLEQSAANATAVPSPNICECTNKTYDDMLEGYLSQPINETLSAADFEYIQLAESNFDTFLNRATHPAVLFMHSGTDDNATRGLAALTRGIYDEFKSHELYSPISDPIFIYCREVSDIHNEPKKIQEIGTPPAIGLYAREPSGELQHMRTIQDPPTNVTELKAVIDIYSDYIRKDIID